MRNNHLGHNDLREEFYCSSCYRVFASQHSGGRHAKACDQPPSTAEASELASLLTGHDTSASTSDVTAPSDMPSTQLCGRDLILLYPAAKNTVFCPICGITFGTEKTRAMNSVFRHLECTHKLERQITKKWRCSKCSWLGDGIAMVHHYKSCDVTSTDAQLLSVATLHNTPPASCPPLRQAPAAGGVTARAKAQSQPTRKSSSVAKRNTPDSIGQGSTGAGMSLRLRTRRGVAPAMESILDSETVVEEASKAQSLSESLVDHESGSKAEHLATPFPCRSSINIPTPKLSITQDQQLPVAATPRTDNSVVSPTLAALLQSTDSLEDTQQPFLVPMSPQPATSPIPEGPVNEDNEPEQQSTACPSATSSQLKETNREDERDRNSSAQETPLAEDRPTSLPSPPRPSMQRVDGGTIASGQIGEHLTAQGQVGRNFFDLWAPSFDGCRTLLDLDSVLVRCVHDWARRAARPVGRNGDPDGQEYLDESQHPECSQPRPCNRVPRTARRHRSRQLQRITRRLRNPRADEASRIQKLFKTYPKRAVRQVLGEKSPPYSGTAEEAELYLRDTYVRTPPSREQCLRAFELYEECEWAPIPEAELELLCQPPHAKEIENKLSRATNTAPGMDGLEYRHLCAVDPKGYLLERIYRSVWRIGIPEAWKKSKTVPIYKKGDTTDYSNFRPISLLPTMYKIFSGILCERLTELASSLGWLSPEQKGFLPGVRGIQEHTTILEMVVTEARKGTGRDATIAMLDLCNAFGSIPHQVLRELFESLPIPAGLNRLLNDIYSNNIMEFVVGREAVRIVPTCGVRQGDALSTLVFNLASEPLIRLITSRVNSGFALYGQRAKATAYADDLAALGSNTEELQALLDQLDNTASVLGLKFNADKCACLLYKKGKVVSETITIGGQRIRCLGPEENTNYLGVPIGNKLRFRPPDDLVSRFVGDMDKLAQSLLAPWQKLEVLRSHLLPSFSHLLASGRVVKKDLFRLDMEIRPFLRVITGVPETSDKGFYYADRRVGGLGMFPLNHDANVWTCARAAQLLSSRDETVRNICREQLKDTIMRAFDHTPAVLPLDKYLSGSVDGGLYRLRNVGGGLNIWTLARQAAKALDARIDASDPNYIDVRVDGLSIAPAKAVRGLRSAIRARWTSRLLNCPHDGLVARGLALDDYTKDNARIVSCRTEIDFQDWPLLHASRLDRLKLRGYRWSEGTTHSCRRCGQGRENAFHVLNNCRIGLAQATQRHNSVQDMLVAQLTRKGLRPNVNRALPGTSIRPDIEVTLNGARLMIDVVVAFDDPVKLEAAYKRKVEKYQEHGVILPLVVGSLGSWYPPNDDIRGVLGLNARSWAVFRRRARLAAIKGSMAMLRDHLKVSYDYVADPESLNGPEMHTDAIHVEIISELNRVQPSDPESEEEDDLRPVDFPGHCA
jgi:Reverse transcriptase (RNA-dependent DNA polymerase)